MKYSSSCLINQYHDLATTYGSNHPAVVALCNALKALVETETALDDLELSLIEYDHYDKDLLDFVE